MHARWRKPLPKACDSGPNRYWNALRVGRGRPENHNEGLENANIYARLHLQTRGWAVYLGKSG
jgi:hypothetical protein